MSSILANLKIGRIWIVGIAVYVLAAVFSVGYYHADEHFQLLEYASYKLGNTDLGNLPWEYGQAMRPSMQVLVAYCVTWLFKFTNPFFCAFLLRLLSAILALRAIYGIGKALYKEDERSRKAFYLIALFTWFMPFQAVRFSSENWSAIMIVFAILSVLRNRKLFMAGLLCGLSFCFRYQAAFFVAGLFFWLLFVRKEKIKAMLWFILGFIIVFCLGILTDYWLYGKWVLSSYSYFYINLVQGKAAEFGTDPFYFYFDKIIEQGIAPFGILILVSAAVYMYRQPKSVFTWVALPFFVLHCIISHKELRFVFPLVYFVPVFVHYAIGQAKQASWWNSHYTKILITLFLFFNFLLLPVSSFKPSNPRVALFQELYSKTGKISCVKENPYFNVHWFSYYFPSTFEPRTIEVSSRNDSFSAGELIVMPGPRPLDIPDTETEYRQLPAFLDGLNYGRWQERGNFWCTVRKHDAE